MRSHSLLNILWSIVFNHNSISCSEICSLMAFISRFSFIAHSKSFSGQFELSINCVFSVFIFGHNCAIRYSSKLVVKLINKLLFCVIALWCAPIKKGANIQTDIYTLLRVLFYVVLIYFISIKLLPFNNIINIGKTIELCKFFSKYITIFSQSYQGFETKLIKPIQ